MSSPSMLLQGDSPGGLLVGLQPLQPPVAPVLHSLFATLLVASGVATAAAFYV